MGGEKRFLKLFFLDSLSPKCYVNYVNDAMHIGFDYVSAAYLPHRYVLKPK